MSIMSRVHFHAPVTLIKKLRAKARQEGIGLAELIRRILFAHFD